MTHAFETIPGRDDAPLFVFGDHASRFIPDTFSDLGLLGDDLTRHIAWDIGTEFIIREMCQAFGCKGLLATVSRLVIDLNRDPDGAGLIPDISDGTRVPKNQNLSAEEAAQRKAQFHTPYHTALGTALNTGFPAPSDPLIISMHSFTDHPRTGEARKTDIGLLTRHDFATTERFQDILQTLRPDYCVEVNQPYSAFDLNYTIDRHVVPLGFRHLAIEVRQSHINTDAGAAAMSALLINAIKPLIGLTP